jgi:tetratricopeptide (TPR) repeat protein
MLYSYLRILWLVPGLFWLSPAEAQTAPAPNTLVRPEGVSEEDKRLRQLVEQASAAVGEDPTAARQYAQQAVKLAQALGEPRQQAHALDVLGKLHRDAARSDSAFYFFGQALALRIPLHDPHALATSYNYIGSVHLTQDVYAQALEYFYKALEIEERLHRDSVSVHTLSSLGLAYESLKNYDKALYYYWRAVRKQQDEGDQRGLARQLDNMGSAYLHMQRPYHCPRLFFPVARSQTGRGYPQRDGLYVAKHWLKLLRAAGAATGRCLLRGSPPFANCHF